MKYLILLLSFQVSAEITDDAMAGICAVMVSQIEPESVNTGILQYWETTAKKVDMTLIEYHKMCVIIVNHYKQVQINGDKAKAKI